MTRGPSTADEPTDRGDAPRSEYSPSPSSHER